VIIFHDPRCADYAQAGHPERPARTETTVRLFQHHHPEWEWRIPQPATESALLRAHTPQHLELIRNAAHDFDADTPAYPAIWDHARRAAGAAIAVAREALKGNQAFSLMRPPGHHATRDRAMGFCYFSNVAIAALESLQNGAERVAIWDFDAHHGNGTEDIVAGNARIIFASIHQFPCYPGSGGRSSGNIHNFPVAPLTPRAEHVEAVRHALDQLIAFNPNLLLVSAGFDAYVGDPITEMTLETEDFRSFGTWLAESRIPTGAILEGGYSDDLPRLIDAFLRGWIG
jgi:acetoin utilization deacetylase AcuC-like enzyme